MNGRMGTTLILLVATALGAGNSVARDVSLVERGKARCVIVVPEGSMVWEGHDRQVDR